jgi:hypothetical protein
MALARKSRRVAESQGDSGRKTWDFNMMESTDNLLRGRVSYDPHTLKVRKFNNSIQGSSEKFGVDVSAKM